MFKSDEEIRKIVKTIIDEWDPMDLLSHCPDDEYESEIILIETLLFVIEDASTFAKCIWRLFTRMNGEVNFTIDDCIPIAQKILDAVNEK